MVDMKFDPADAALREIIRYELTNIHGPLEYRVNRMLTALQGRALLLAEWEKKLETRKRRQRRK